MKPQPPQNRTIKNGKLVIKTCKNCFYNQNDTCALSGLHYKAERLLKGSCSADFDGWLKKETTISKIINKLKQWI